MVMTRSGGFSRIRLMERSFSNKGKIFDKEGLAMRLIDMEPLRFALRTLLVPYGTSD